MYINLLEHECMNEESLERPENSTKNWYVTTLNRANVGMGERKPYSNWKIIKINYTEKKLICTKYKKVIIMNILCKWNYHSNSWLRFFDVLPIIKWTGFVSNCQHEFCKWKSKLKIYNMGALFNTLVPSFS